jgi:hypothetical protein
MQTNSNSPEDMLLNPLAVGDYVVFYSGIYQVVGLGKGRLYPPRVEGPVRLKMLNSGDTNRPVTKSSRDVVKVPVADVERLVAASLLG